MAGSDALARGAVAIRSPAPASTAGVQIGILGPLQVVCSGAEQTGRRGVHRLLLSVLAADPASHSVDELLDVLSYVRPGRGWTRQNVYSAVARLRSELPGVVVSTRGAYSLDRSACIVDLDQFESLAHQARNDLVSGDASAAVEGLRAALALWRGTALGAWRAHPKAEAIGARLDEVRLGAVEDLARALVTAGEPGEAVGVARDLLNAHPEREHTWASLLMALDALGATDEVWRTYDQARRLLAEAGLDPGVELEQVLGRLGPSTVDGEVPTTDGSDARRSLHPLVRLATERPLIGRDGELATLQRLAASALEGAGAQLVLLDGAAGVGKTRLAAEVAARAFETGATVWFEVGEDRLEAPYGSLANLVRRLLEALEPSARHDALRGPLGRLVSSADQDQPAGGGPARWALVEAVAELICRAIPTGGVLVIDDLHHLPADGVDLIRHLFVSRPECRLLLVATHRDGAAPVGRSDPSRELRHLPMTTTLRLRELDSEGSVELMADLTGSALDAADQRRRLMELTHGNPLLISAVAKDPELCEEIRLGARHAPLGVASVAAQVARLLGRLDESSVAVLEAAAVVGQRFDRRVLWSLDRAAVPFDAAAVNEALVTAVRSGLMATDAANPDEFTFVHDLARRGIYDTLGETERAKLHWLVGTAVARMSTAEDRTTVLAHHLLAAWPVCPTGEVVDRLQAAALEAAHMLAPERADELFGMALDVAGRYSSGLVDEARCMLLLLAGVTRLELGRSNEAVALVREAVGIAQRHGWRDEVGLSLLGLADNCRVLALPPRAGELLRNTSADVVPRYRGDLLYLLQQVDADAAADAEQQALALDNRLSDTAAAASALGAISLRHLGPRQVEAADALSRLGQSAGDPGLEGLGLLYGWVAQIGIGEAGFDDDVAIRIDRLAEATDLAQFGWSWHLWRALVALHHRGDLGLAVECLETARALVFPSDDDEPWLDARTLRFQLGCNIVGAAIASVGDDTALYRRFRAEELDPMFNASRDFRALRAKMHAHFGETEQAARLCDAVVGDGLLDRPRSQDWLLQVICLAGAYARLGDAAAARTLVPFLESQRHCHVLTDVISYAGSVERYLGMLYGACDDWDAAVASFHAAIDRHDRAKAVTINIQTYLELAWALTHRGGAGDREAVAVWRDRAINLAESIGAKPVASDPWAEGD